MLELQIEPAHSAVSQARIKVRDYVDRSGISSALAADVELVVAELTSNAVDHGPSRPIDIDLLHIDSAVYLTVSNHMGARQDYAFPAESSGDPLTDRGRGLAIVHTLVDGMWVHGLIDSTSITCLLKKDRSKAQGQP